MKAADLYGWKTMPKFHPDSQSLSLTFTTAKSAARAFNLLRNHMERGLRFGVNPGGSMYEDLDLGPVLLRQVFVTDMSTETPSGFNQEFKISIKFYTQCLDVQEEETPEDIAEAQDLLALAKEVH